MIAAVVYLLISAILILNAGPGYDKTELVQTALLMAMAMLLLVSLFKMRRKPVARHATVIRKS